MRQRVRSCPVLVSRAAILVMLLLAQALPARAEPPVPAPVASGIENEPNQADPAVPNVAHRLWHDLHCACQESNCLHEALEACECRFAVEDRRWILDEVKRLGFGSTETDRVTYGVVAREYAARQEASTRTARLRWWVQSALSLLAVVGGIGAIFWLAERLRRQSNARGEATKLQGRRRGKHRGSR